MKPTKTEVRVARCAERVAAGEKLKPETLKTEMGTEAKFLTRRELAGVLKVSVRTVDAMVAAGEITPVRIRGVLVRFYLPDVVRELTAAAVMGKGLTTDDADGHGFSEKAETLKTEMLKSGS